jgi:hypothetical protein
MTNIASAAANPIACQVDAPAEFAAALSPFLDALPTPALGSVNPARLSRSRQ